MAFLSMIMGGSVETVRLLSTAKNYQNQAEWFRLQEDCVGIELQLRSEEMKYLGAGLAWDIASPSRRAEILVGRQIELATLRRRVDYFRMMRVKYEDAARHLWTCVEPDPPEPR
jgi:hypothetical protein